MSRLRVVHANLYAGNKRKRAAVAKLAELRPDTAGVSEGTRFLELLGRRRGYRLTHGDVRGFQRRRGAHDTPILTRHRFPSLGSLAIQASQATRPRRLAPERWITVELFAHPVGRVAHINVHPNAAVVGHPATVPRVREYAEFMVTLVRVLRFLKAEGYRRVLTGDVNYPKSGRRVPWSPYVVLAAAGMRSRNRGPDVIAWDRSLELKSWRVIGPGETGADHPWLLAELAG